MLGGAPLFGLAIASRHACAFHFALGDLGLAQQPGQMFLDIGRCEADRLLRPSFIIKDTHGGPHTVPRIQPMICHKAGRFAEERDEALLMWRLISSLDFGSNWYRRITAYMVDLL